MPLVLLENNAREGVLHLIISTHAWSVLKCSKSTIKTLEQGGKHVRS